jgi:hypothetical protein
MTISVRLTEKIEILLRDEAKKQNKNISDIVNEALEKYHNEYKYFDSINAHHLDPVVVKAFFSLIDTPEKADKISTAGAIMIEKFATYFSNGDKSIETKIKFLMKFLNQNSIQIKTQHVGNKINMAAIHQHDEIYSYLLVGLITKIFLNFAKVETMEMKKGAFSISIEIKNEV